MKSDHIDSHLFDLLDELKPVVSRDPHVEARGRARFLAEAVSLREKPRHNGWMIFPLKEKLAMKLLVSTLVIVGLLFGGSATVSAAQDDLPNQPLYQVKLMSEDVNLWFVWDRSQQIHILMEQAQTRLQEMEMLAAQGIVPPDAAQVRAQECIERALQIAAQLDPASQPAALQQIQTRLQTQEQLVLRLEQGTCSDCVPMLQRTRQMLQIHLREMENGPKGPGTLQDQDQTQNQNQLRMHQTPQPNVSTSTPCANCTPALDGTGQQNGNGAPAGATPIQQPFQNQQNHQGGGGAQNGNGSGDQGGRP